MRKLKLQMQLSLDGFVAGSQGQMDWMTWNWDQALKDYVRKITEPVDLIVLGRKLAEGFIPTWETRLANPDTADDAARKFVNTPKVVFSKTLKSTDWSNTTLATGELVDEIKRLKALPGNDIIAYGGASFASALIAHHLIDEYHLFINPVALGAGLIIFGSISQNKNLQLVSAQQYECGVSVLVYQPAS